MPRAKSKSGSIKVFHLITALYQGGAQSMLTKLLLNQQNPDIRQAVITLKSNGFYREELEKAGVVVHSFDFSRGLFVVWELVRLIGFLRRERPDVLMTWLYHADVIGAIAGRLARVKRVVWNVRCSDMGFQGQGWSRSLLMRVWKMLSGWPNCIVYNSKAGHSFHLGLGAKQRTWQLVGNGFDTDLYKPDARARASVRQELGVAADVPLVGLMARYHEMKDHQCFLQAAREIVRQQEVHFVLAGDLVVPENRDLARKIERLGLKPYMHLLGKRRDMPRLIAAMDVVALSSCYGEGFPNVLGEAMSCGVPCVATDVGDSLMILDDMGKVVPPRDPLALADACLEVLAEPLAERQKHGKKLRRRVQEHFSIPVAVKRFESLYFGFLKQASSPATDTQQQGSRKISISKNESR